MMDEPARIAKKIRSAVTDTGGEVRVRPARKAGRLEPAGHPLHPVRGPVEDLERTFAGRGYGDLKKEVADVVVEAVTPFRQRMTELLGDPAELDRILADGADRARDVARATVTRVYDAVGLLPAVK